MCTLSVINNDSQLIVTMNRDESRDRPETDAIKHISDRNSQHYPQDQQSGGTWFGFNQSGITLALLNRYQDETGRGEKSRGELIPSLLQHDNATDILNVLAAIDYAPYAPFDLVVTTTNSVDVLSWNGTAATQQTHTTPFFITSSSRRHHYVLEHRQQLFTQFIEKHNSTLTAEALLNEFHLYQNPEDACASINMARDVSHTKSLSQLTIEKHALNYYYFTEATLQNLASSDAQGAHYSQAQHHGLSIFDEK